MKMFVVLFFILGEYQDIVDEHYHELVQIFHEYFIHELHEIGRGISQSK
jgi:hypothetical protein